MRDHQYRRSIQDNQLQMDVVQLLRMELMVDSTRTSDAYRTVLGEQIRLGWLLRIHKGLVPSKVLHTIKNPHKVPNSKAIRKTDHRLPQRI